MYRLDLLAHAALALLILTNQGVDCSRHGTTLEALPIKKGHWRAALRAKVVHKCPNEVWYRVDLVYALVVFMVNVAWWEFSTSMCPFVALCIFLCETHNVSSAD